MSRPPSPPRRGAILIVVLALLALFAVVGVSFVFFAGNEAAVARIHREAAGKPDIAPPDATVAVNRFLGTLVYDAGDTGDDLNNAVRGHSLLRAMYGWSGSATDSFGQPLHAVPFNGVGTTHDRVDLSATFGRPPNSYVLPDRARVVNYTLLPWGTLPKQQTLALTVFDPEFAGYRDQTGYTTGPTIGGGRAYIGRNAPYTYPDLKDFYLAAVSPRTGEVLVPSFHRSWLFNGTYTDPANTDETVRLAPWDPANPARAGLTDWVGTEGRMRLLRPRPVDQLTDAELATIGLARPIDPAALNKTQRQQLFQLIDGKIAAGEILPYPAPNGDGSFTGDVQNLVGGVGTQRNDSLLLDVGMPPVRWRGTLVKPLVAALVTDADGRLNDSAHGNGRGAGGGHASGGGYGPWEVNLAAVLGTDAAAVVAARGPPRSRAGLADPYAFDPAGGTLPEYGLVNWDGTAAGTPSPPDFATQTALRTALSYPRSYTDNSTPSGSQASGHPGLFNPVEWSWPTGQSNRVFAVADLRRLNLRFAPPPDSNLYLDVGIAAPTDLRGAAKPGANYRLDPAHANRLSVTPLSAGLDRPMLTPNFDGTSYLRLTGGRLSHAGTSSVPRPPTAAGGDYASDDGRNRRAALGPVDLNRALADYRDLTAWPNIDPQTGRPTPQPPGPANMRNALRAWADRHNLARDVFARLVVATGAMATVDAASGDVTIAADPAKNQPEFDALRQLAQIAVNVVDYTDADDVSTPFRWNPSAGALTAIGPAQLTDPAFTSDFAQPANRVVFGVEKPRLVLNEVYSETVNHPDETPATVSIDGKDVGPQQPAVVRFWVELLNPTGRPYTGGAAGPLGDGTAYLSAYQIQVARQRTAKGGTPANDLRDAANVRGDFLSVSPEIVYDFSSPRVQSVGPNGAAAAPVAYNPAATPALGIALFGPPTPPPKNGPEGVVWQPETKKGLFAQMAVSAAPSNTPGATENALAYNLDIKAVTDDFLGKRESLRHVVLLRRLANPHLPPNDPADAKRFNPLLPVNVFITVDYLDWVPSFDAVVWTRGKGEPRGQGKGNGNGGGKKKQGYDPIGERFAVGKSQPYAGNAFSPGNAGPDGYPSFPYPASSVLAQNPTGRPGQPIEPKHTFGRHNGTTATAAAYTTATALPANPAETIALPFDWYVQPDRLLANQLELLWVAGVAPHRVTQSPPRPDLGTRRTDAQVNWLTQDAPLYRALEFLRVKPWGFAAAPGGRVHGRVNLNTVQDPRVLAALADPQAGNGFTPDDVTALWAALIGSSNPGSTGADYRTFTHRTATLADGTPVTVPVPGRTVDDDPDASADVPLDRPFKALGAGQLPGSGVHDTLLRPDVGTLLPRLWLSSTYTAGSGNAMAVVDRSHPYFRSEAVRKVFNNVTTVSNVFTVTVTVVFHEVRTHGDDPLTEPGTGRVLLGKEVYKEVPGDVRQQFFAVIDRSAAALDPSNPAAPAGERPFFTTLLAPAVPAAQPVGVPYTTSRLSVAYGAFDPVGKVMTVHSDGAAVSIRAGSRLVLGVGAESEVVTVADDVPGVGTPFNADGTVNVYGSGNAGVAYFHPTGACVSNVRPGNPGPQRAFGRLTAASPAAVAVVPFVVRVR